MTSTPTDGQPVNEGLFPERFGSSPTPNRITDKLILAFFPLLAVKIRNLPPIDPKDPGQTMLVAAHPVRPSMSPAVIPGARSSTFHDLPPFLASPHDCNMPGVGVLFPSHVTRPTVHGCQCSVPQGRKVQPVSQRVSSTFCCSKPVHPRNILGLPTTQHTAKPPGFLN